MSYQTSEWGCVEEAGGLLYSFIKAQRWFAKVFRLWPHHQPTAHSQWPWGRQQPVQLEPPCQHQPWPREPVRPSQGQSPSCSPQGQSPGGAGTPCFSWQSFIRGGPTGRNSFYFSSLVSQHYKSYHNIVTPVLQQHIGCVFIKCLDQSLHFTGSRAGLGGEAGQSDPVQRPGHQPVAGGDPGWVNESYSRPGLCCQAAQALLQHTGLPGPPEWGRKPRAPRQQAPAQALWEGGRIQAWLWWDGEFSLHHYHASLSSKNLASSHCQLFKSSEKQLFFWVTTVHFKTNPFSFKIVLLQVIRFSQEYMFPKLK